MSRIFNQENVLAYIQEHIGTKYTAAVLAGIFKVAPVLMRELLTELLATRKIESVSGHSKFYFVPKPVVDPMTTQKYNRPFKALVLPAAFGERRRELYPEGHSLAKCGGKS